MATRIKEKKQTAKRPVKTEGYSHDIADRRKDKRRQEAIARQRIYASKSAADLLEGLDARDLEARRERAKLYQALHNVTILTLLA